MKRYLIAIFMVSIPFFCKATPPLLLTEELHEVCLCRQVVSYFEDKNADLTISEIINLKNSNAFKESRAADLINDTISSAYWLHFNLKSQTDKPFRIELYDYDIDDISLYMQDENGIYKEHKAGYKYPFDKREINHKNISFRVLVQKGTTSGIYMRFKSSRHNVLEPILKSYDKFLDYGFTEYLLFGLFYGLMILMIFYNFLYYILLRKSHFLYYVVFGTGILLYITAENGTGFQFLWPDHPEFNTYSSPIGLYIGIMAMLFFAYRFLHLNKRGPLFKKIFLTAIITRTLIFGFQLIYPDSFKWELLDILFIQLILIAGIWRYRFKPAKWYIIAYALLDISFLITGFEKAGILTSSVLTVYSFNIGIILNFIFLSIAIGEAIQETYKLKNEAYANLLLEYKKNDVLKEKINRELEQLVKERTLVLQAQNIEIQKQKEEIKEMYENLEELVKKRTFQLEERNSRIKEYSFSNSHLVRGPLARILGLINVIKIENIISLELLGMIEVSAKELDKVVREMNKILDDNQNS